MMRRVVVSALGALAAFCILAGPAAACDRSHNGADWACLYVEHVDTGLCQQNPLPQELPVPVPEDLQVVPDERPEVAPLVESVVLPLVPDVKPEVPSDPATLLSDPTSVLGGTTVPTAPGTPSAPPAPSTPTAPSAPDAPYVPSGMPGTPI